MSISSWLTRLFGGPDDRVYNPAIDAMREVYGMCTDFSPSRFQAFFGRKKISLVPQGWFSEQKLIPSVFVGRNRLVHIIGVLHGDRTTDEFLPIPPDFSNKVFDRLERYHAEHGSSPDGIRIEYIHRVTANQETKSARLLELMFRLYPEQNQDFIVVSAPLHRERELLKAVETMHGPAHEFGTQKTTVNDVLATLRTIQPLKEIDIPYMEPGEKKMLENREMR